MTRVTRLSPRLTAADILYPPTAQVDVPVAVGTQLATDAVSPVTQTGTARCPLLITVDCNDLRLVYHNWFTTTGGLEAIPATDLNIGGVGVEYNGTIYRVTFQGKTAVVVNPGGHVISDPISIEVTANTFIYTRTFISSGTSYVNRWSYIAQGGGGFTATTDLSAPGAGTIADGAAYLNCPSVVLGTPKSRISTLFVYGDSLAEGFNDGLPHHPGVNTVSTNLGGGGYIARAARSAGFGVLNAAIQGGKAQDWITAGAHLRRGFWSRQCRSALVTYGRNDLTAGRTTAQLQADVIAIWTIMAAKGLRTFHPTITPLTSSTDGWQTLGNQTVGAGDAARIAFNAWLRDGAPMAAGAAVAVGTAGAARCRYMSGNTIVTPASGPTHPLYGTIEMADVVESARDSGKWAVAGLTSRTVTDAVVFSSTKITSATANFTAADLGMQVIMPTAGVAGGQYLGQLSQINTSSNVTLLVAITAAVSTSGLTATITNGPTVEGIHPMAWQSPSMASALPTNYFI